MQVIYLVQQQPRPALRFRPSILYHTRTPRSECPGHKVLEQITTTSLSSELPALTNITRVECALFQTSPFRSFPQHSRRLQHLFFRENPRSPVDPHRFLALCVCEDVHAVVWIGMHGRHDESRVVRSDRNEAKIKWTPELADLFESWTGGQVREFLIVVKVLFGQFRN